MRVLGCGAGSEAGVLIVDSSYALSPAASALCTIVCGGLCEIRKKTKQNQKTKAKPKMTTTEPGQRDDSVVKSACLAYKHGDPRFILRFHGRGTCGQDNP